MKDAIVNLAEWKASHPPIVRLWMAQSRCVSEWWKLWMRLWVI